MKEIVLKAKHFQDTSFLWGKGGCAIEKAVKEVKPNSKVTEKVDSIKIDGEIFLHEEYGGYAFAVDKKKAKTLNYSDKVVRVIKIKNDK